jgi:sortase A
MPNSLGKAVLQNGLIFGILCLILFGGANAQAISKEAGFAVHKPASQDIVAPAVSKPQDPPRISIPAIGVDAPLILHIPAATTEDFLEQGVVQMAEGADPGQVGNLFLTGHSSDYAYKHDPFATVFTLLPKLQAGDKIFVSAGGKVFTYTVTSTEVVRPDQVEIAEPSATPTLTAITCYPISTTWKRFVIHAALTS